MLTGFWWGNLRERYDVDYPGVHGRIILKWFCRKWDVRALDWIDLSPDRDR